MSYSFQIHVDGVIDGSTVVQVPTPLPTAAPSGVFAWSVAAFGILDSTRLRQLLGTQGMWLVAIGIEAAPGTATVGAGLVRPSSYTDQQAIYDDVAPAVAVPLRRGPYVPQGWRFRSTALDGAGNPFAGSHVIYLTFEGVTSFVDVCRSSSNPSPTVVVSV